MPKPSLRIRTEQLDIARRAVGLNTHTDLARAAHVSQTTISRVLAGETGVGVDVLVGLLLAFPNLQFSDLFEIGEDAGTEAAA